MPLRKALQDTAVVAKKRSSYKPKV